jgi:competence protein ComEA
MDRGVVESWHVRTGRWMWWAQQPRRGKLIYALNAMATLLLLALIMARFIPGVPQALISELQTLAANQASSNTLTITGPGMSGEATLTAEVLGDVLIPGVYTLSDGSRVQDLVAAAGGAQSNADLTQVNLAARLVDGQEVYVPRVGEMVPLTLGGKIDINVASAQELHDALGISMTIASRIVAFRATHGDFASVSQLLLVPISRADYDKIAPLVTI